MINNTLQHGTTERKPFYSVREIARLTGRSDYTVRDWCARGYLGSVQTKRRGRLMIPHSALEQFIAAHTRPNRRALLRGSK